MTNHIYLAGPFFDEAGIQKNRILKLKDALEINSTVDTVYVPMEHQDSEYEMFSKQWSKEVYEKDIAALNNADCVVAVYDYANHGMDDGTAFEMGWATAQKDKYQVVFQENDEPMNLMITNSANFFAHDYDTIAKLDFNSKPTNEFEGKVL